MDETPQRLSLNNSVFEGRLRQSRRSPAYVSRPTPLPAKVISDVTTITNPQLASTPKLISEGQKASRIIQEYVVTRKQSSASSLSPNQSPASLKPPHQPQKSLVLHREAAIHQQRLLVAQLDQPTTQAEVVAKTKHKRPMLLYSMAAVIFVIGLTVSLNGLRANRQVAAQVQHLTSQSGSDDNGSHPSTQKPSASSIANYAVAPNLPRYIDIAKLSVHARVLSLGVTSDNQLKAPGNVFDAGWYNASAQPGQPGGMLIDGHISSWTAKGVFYGLNKLVAGDLIVITRGDGKQFTYTVVKTQLFDASQVDMASLLVSQDTSKPGLNLISCSGDVIPGTSEFNKRLAVYAVMQ